MVHIMEYKHYLRPSGKGIKLHLGCGDYWFEGYINIDINVYGGTDLIWDIKDKLPFQDHVVEVIEAYEVVEHFSKQEIDRMIEEWKRLLIDGGRVRISVPDLEALSKQLDQVSEENKKMIIEDMYGMGGYQTHKWGYTKNTLEKLFADHLFTHIQVVQGELSERAGEPKLILEAIYESR